MMLMLLVKDKNSHEAGGILEPGGTKISTTAKVFWIYKCAVFLNRENTLSEKLLF